MQSEVKDETASAGKLDVVPETTRDPKSNSTLQPVDPGNTARPLMTRLRMLKEKQQIREEIKLKAHIQQEQLRLTSQLSK